MIDLWQKCHGLVVCAVSVVLVGGKVAGRRWQQSGDTPHILPRCSIKFKRRSHKEETSNDWTMPVGVST